MKKHIIQKHAGTSSLPSSPPLPCSPSINPKEPCTIPVHSPSQAPGWESVSDGWIGFKKLRRFLEQGGSGGTGLSGEEVGIKHHNPLEPVHSASLGGGSTESHKLAGRLEALAEPSSDKVTENGMEDRLEQKDLLSENAGKVLPKIGVQTETKSHEDVETPPSENAKVTKSYYHAMIPDLVSFFAGFKQKDSSKGPNSDAGSAQADDARIDDLDPPEIKHSRKKSEEVDHLKDRPPHKKCNELDHLKDKSSHKKCDELDPLKDKPSHKKCDELLDIPALEAKIGGAWFDIELLGVDPDEDLFHVMGRDTGEKEWVTCKEVRLQCQPYESKPINGTTVCLFRTADNEQLYYDAVVDSEKKDSKFYVTLLDGPEKGKKVVAKLQDLYEISSAKLPIASLRSWCKAVYRKVDSLPKVVNLKKGDYAMFEAPGNENFRVAQLREPYTAEIQEEVDEDEDGPEIRVRWMFTAQQLKKKRKKLLKGEDTDEHEVFVSDMESLIDARLIVDQCFVSIVEIPPDTKDWANNRFFASRVFDRSEFKILSISDESLDPKLKKIVKRLLSRNRKNGDKPVNDAEDGQDAESHQTQKRDSSPANRPPQIGMDLPLSNSLMRDSSEEHNEDLMKSPKQVKDKHSNKGNTKENIVHVSIHEDEKHLHRERSNAKGESLENISRKRKSSEPDEPARAAGASKSEGNKRSPKKSHGNSQLQSCADQKVKNGKDLHLQKKGSSLSCEETGEKRDKLTPNTEGKKQRSEKSVVMELSIPKVGFKNMKTATFEKDCNKKLSSEKSCGNKNDSKQRDVHHNKSPRTITPNRDFGMEVSQSIDKNSPSGVQMKAESFRPIVVSQTKLSNTTSPITIQRENGKQTAEREACNKSACFVTPKSDDACEKGKLEAVCDRVEFSKGLDDNGTCSHHNSHKDSCELKSIPHRKDSVEAEMYDPEVLADDLDTSVKKGTSPLVDDHKSDSKVEALANQRVESKCLARSADADQHGLQANTETKKSLGTYLPELSLPVLPVTADHADERTQETKENDNCENRGTERKHSKSSDGTSFPSEKAKRRKTTANVQSFRISIMQCKWKFIAYQHVDGGKKVEDVSFEHGENIHCALSFRDEHDRPICDERTITCVTKMLRFHVSDVHSTERDQVVTPFGSSTFDELFCCQLAIQEVGTYVLQPFFIDDKGEKHFLGSPERVVVAPERLSRHCAEISLYQVGREEKVARLCMPQDPASADHLRTAGIVSRGTKVEVEIGFSRGGGGDLQFDEKQLLRGLPHLRMRWVKPAEMEEGVWKECGGRDFNVCMSAQVIDVTPHVLSMRDSSTRVACLQLDEVGCHVLVVKFEDVPKTFRFDLACV
eukprot:768354-Hanusia_phi.AAC.3